MVVSQSSGPRRGGGLRDAVFELLVHPLHRAGESHLLRLALLRRVLAIGRRCHGAKGAAQAVVADDPGHAQDARSHAVTTQCTHVSVAAMPVQDRQHSRPEHVHQLGRVRARVAQRATMEPALEQAGGFKVLGEERQLAQRGGTASLVPA